MKRPLSLAALMIAVSAFPASAILDTNSNGLSDPWEMMYNDGELFPSTDFPCGPQDDFDCDGWTNEEEAAAGTNPFDANPPDGLLRPDIVHIPAVLIDTDSDGIPDTISTPEVVTISWPTIPGKQYTLLYSPDLVDWLPVTGETFVSDGSPAEYDFTLTEDSKLFWRVSIEDVDSDSDGLTDAEECLFGTDPGNSQTIADIPDLWLARYFTNILLASGPSAIDPNAVSNSDGYTIAQMAFLNLDPNATNYPALGKETIINGNFSQPAIGSAPSNTSDPTWDYWGEGGVPGWTAVVGHNIELQNVETTGTNGQYCELKADPANHYGIKQQVRTQKGVTYLLVLDCKARQDTTLANNQFSVNKDGTFLQSVTPTVAWATNAVSFTATKVITEISLVPDNNPNDTMGCLVDNVELIPVGVKTLSFSGDNYYQLTTDDASTAYAAPHWVDLNGDGKASTSQDGERNYPIAYTRNTKPKVAGTFKLNSIPVGCPLKIKATSSHGLQIPETAVYAPIDGTVTLPLTESSTALVNDIKFFNAEDASAFKIDWFIKVADSEWVSIGSTSHTMSITFATPITNERQESLFAVSCMQGQGAGSEAVDIITEKIFAYFKGLDVRQMKPSSGTPMQNSFTQKGMGFYAYGSLNTQDGFTKELLTNGDGRCTGWAHFFKDCLAVHGITSVIEQIIPIYDNQNDYLTGSAFMLIKEFNFLDGSLPTSYLPFTHDNEKEPPEVTKGESIHGQSMVAPPQRIKNHFLVYQNSRVFDPSYGVGPCTLLEWETTAISGYYCKKPLDEDQDGIQDVDSEGKPKFKNIAKKKTPNQLEIEFAQP